jgi:L-ascorbate metabolism protein UlaG (beta-lactamase superfamily)
VKITYVGHATCIVEMKGCKFITDPVLAKRIAWVGPKRKVGLRLDDGALDGLDFVTISHGHFDHLDKRSLCMLDKAVPVVSYPNLRGIVRRACHRNTVGIGWWESANVGGVGITAVPAFHFSVRPPFHYTKDYQGYVIEGERTVYHAGDCGMSKYFEKIGKKFKIDVAMLPIGAYDPPSFREKHLAPEDALDAMEALGARLMIPIHWGTFSLSWEPFDEPPRRLMEHAAKRGLTDRIRLLRPGESTVID